MDNLIGTEVTIITALTALITAVVALVKAVRGDGRKTSADTPAEKTTTDE